MDESTINHMPTSSKSDERSRLLNGNTNLKRTKNDKCTEIRHCCLFIFIMITILGGLIGLFFLVKVTFDGWSDESCQLLRYDKHTHHRRNSNTVKNETNLSKTISSIKTSIGLDKKKNNCSCQDIESDVKSTRQDEINLKEPYSYMLNMVSTDNLVKLDFRGYVIIEDLTDKYTFVSNLGNKAVLTHTLDDNEPTLAITFHCGEIIFYLNTDLDNSSRKYETIMVTGKTNSGIIYGHREFFEWRTPTLPKPLFVNVINKEHYYCDEKKNMRLLIHKETNFQLTLVLQNLELEIFRPPNHDRDKFATPRGRRLLTGCENHKLIF